MISLVFLSFHSAHHIRRILKTINQKYKIIVIENSSDLDLKYELEKKYSNVHVEVCSENLGFSKGMNLGIKLAETKFVFLNPADIDISNKLLNSLEDITKSFDDFGMLTPAYKDRSIHSNFYVWKKKGIDKIISTPNNNYKLKEVDFIDGTILLNKQKVKNEIFDENFFIYFETMDLSKRLIEKNIKLFACEELTFNHYGGQSHEKKFNFQAQLSRCWHYNWSKFYYYRKHYNYFHALKKTLPNFKRALISFFFNSLFFFKNNSNENRLLALNEMKGIISSAMFKKSSYRLQYKK